VFILPFRYAMIITALGLGLAAVVLVMMLDLFNHIFSGDPFSIISWLFTNFILLLIIMIIIAGIITAITWGYWLGDLGGGRRRGDDRSDEAKAALEVLEKKYANKEITMTEYLALRKGIDRDRPKY
jgi:uncharacterized membrane protein